ncbi:universal stress protein [Microlunatus flavus]|uniref:Nucleotide-binding universal stress protein, UspA family n=1 Tax=Microlunatus flavus TaxID=1036181 RepID=A0A1H9J8W3_9ACTN|nr:universal stress protein [Microlunatus flavus]SEQ83169.1 Nucleotide-binding universal stress protein, UspA family [Microlunatus flavus]
MTVVDETSREDVRPDAAQIVVGYSSRPEGRAALRRAVAEATLRSASLVVLHGPEDDVTELESELQTSGVAHRLESSADGGDLAEDLLDLAESTSAAFIVIGLRRRSPVGKLLLGSNAQRVLLDAACPVLAVKAEQP